MDSSHCPRVIKLTIHALSDGFSDDFFIPGYRGGQPHTFLVRRSHIKHGRHKSQWKSEKHLSIETGLRQIGWANRRLACSLEAQKATNRKHHAAVQARPPIRPRFTPASATLSNAGLNPGAQTRIMWA